MSDSSIQNSLFETMKIFSDYATANSDATITVEAQIAEVVDAGANQYSVEYLGNTFLVHSATDAAYSVGDNVYVLIPDGDFTKDKIILGLISASAEIYADGTNEDAIYNEVSDNLINQQSEIIKLSSYSEYTSQWKPINSNTINTLFTDFLTNYHIFKFSFYAKTALSSSQQSSGNYGVSLRIPLIATSTSGGGNTTQIYKTIDLDVSNMLGDPYRFTTWAPQSIYFTIDSQYIYDDSLSIDYRYYCSDFPQDSTKANIKDIQIKDLSFNVVDEIQVDETTGYSLSLQATEGVYFSTYYTQSKIITPILKVNGKTTAIRNAEIYWFKEDAETTIQNSDYVSYGGYGWSCINDKENVTYNSDGTQTFNYDTSQDSLLVSSSDIGGVSLRYKCVVIYKTTVVSSIITIKNLQPKQDIILESTSGTGIYIKDTGYVDLSALVYIENVTNKDSNKTCVNYYWQRYDKNNNFINDDTSFFEVIEYNTSVTRDNKTYYLTRVRFPVNRIEDINTVFCTAKYIQKTDDDDIVTYLIGTQNLTLSTSADFVYNLNINNDDIIYKYDSDGDSPAGSAYDGPSTSKVTSITALTYTLRKGDGVELTDTEYLYCHYIWKIPKNSMFTKPSNSTDEDDNYYYVSGYGHTTALNYSIASRFNISKAKHSVLSLTVEFLGNTLTCNANINFIKEGMSGSNGTTYAAQLISGWPGDSQDNFVPYGVVGTHDIAEKLKFVYNTSSKKLYAQYYDKTTKSLTLKKYDDSLTVNNKFYIIPQVYENGELLNYSSNTKITGTYAVEYSMFDSSTTKPCFEVEKDNTTGKAILTYNNGTIDMDNPPCNIVQAKITVHGQGGISSATSQILYCYYPIEILIANTDTDIYPNLTGGFSEVMYASDGTNPSWDETSNFILTVDNAIEDYYKDYCTVEWTAVNNFTCSFPDKQNTYECKVKPNNKYDSGNSYNYVQATLTVDNTQLKTELNTLETDINTYSEKINISTINQKALQEFGNSYTYSDWLAMLLEAKTNLNNQTEAIYSLRSILNTSLNKLEEYLNKQSKVYDNQDIKSYCSNLITDINNLKTNIKSIIKIIQQYVAEEDNIYSLSDLQLARLSSSTAYDETYIINLFGQNTAQKLQLLIQNVNMQISDYNDQITKLNNIATFDNFIKRQIKSQILECCEKLATTKIYSQYVTLKEVCLTYVKQFDENTSITDLQSILDNIYNKVLKGVFDKKDGVLTLSEAIQNKFETEQSEYQSQINEDNNRINIINSVLKYGNNHKFVYIRPIVLYFNRYEMSNINAWDGNKIVTDDGYLLAPQIGAGIKDSSNAFTGIVMGQKNITTDSNTTSARQGLYGYSSGTQSFALDAGTGAAIFGKAGKKGGGQITIDPSSTQALLYSSNFFKNWNNTTGLPTSYGTSNYAKAGMLINLSTPEIRFGNGNFVVTADGNTTIAGSNNTIGGWKVTSTEIYSNVTKNNGRITLDSGQTLAESLDENGNIQYKDESNPGKIYSHSHSTLTNTGTGFYLSSDGLSVGSQFKITSNGIVSVGNGAVSGSSGSKHWTIDTSGDNSYIGYGTSNFCASTSDNVVTISNASNGQVYIGTNGIRLGTKFAVDSDGNVVAHYLKASTGGSIGGWTINGTQLTGGGTTLDSGGTITCSTLIANSAGSIGGWTISNSGLNKNNIAISSSGSISNGDNWSISNDGTAKFKNITCTSTWSFGSGLNTWSNTGGFSFGNGILGGNKVGAATIGLEKATIALGTASDGSNGISYNGSKCTIAGDIYANNGHFTGKITANSGEIGGWSIDSSGLYSGTMHIYPSGIQCNGLLAPGESIVASDGDYSLKNVHDAANEAFKGLANKANTGTYTGSCSITTDTGTYTGSCSITI